MTNPVPAHPATVAFPTLRFPLTVCVVAYGNNVALSRRFLTSLYDTTDSRLFTLRAGLNEVEAATQNLFEEYAARHRNISLFVEPRNRFKCPLMGRLLNSPPVATKWLVWCDDDIHFTRKDWLPRLAAAIESRPEVAQWGSHYRIRQPAAGLREWIETANWYQGLPLPLSRDERGREVLDFVFATGSFWAIRTAALRHLQWPDPRLVQAKEDFLLGEALRQNGFARADFHYGIKVNDAPRRNAAAPEHGD